MVARGFQKHILEFPSGGGRSRPNSVEAYDFIAEDGRFKLNYYTERWFCGEQSCEQERDANYKKVTKQDEVGASS